MGLFGFGKKKEEKALAPCACREGAPQMKTEPCDCGRGARQVKVLGSGCKKCRMLNENAQAAIAELELDAELEYITDMDRIMGFGAMSLPPWSSTERSCPPARCSRLKKSLRT